MNGNVATINFILLRFKIYYVKLYEYTKFKTSNIFNRQEFCFDLMFTNLAYFVLMKTVFIKHSCCGDKRDIQALVQDCHVVNKVSLRWSLLQFWY